MFIPTYFKEKLKKEINLLELVQKYTKVESAGYNVWQAKCPHKDHEDSTPSFRIWKNKDGCWSWACMGCHAGTKNIKDNKQKNYGSDVFAFIQWMSDFKGSKHILSFYEAILLLAEEYGYEVPFHDKQEDYSNILLKNKLLAKCYNKNLSSFVKKYLYKRGLNDDDINKWCIGSNLFKTGFRITFPLIDVKQNILGFSSRLWNWDEKSKYPKYINSKESTYFHKRKYFYGSNLIDDSFNEIRITEGVFDVILSNKYNAKNVIATLGTSFTLEHANIIKKMNKIPVFCLDGDNAGQKATYKSIKLLAQEGIYSKICILPNNMDLADLANNLQFDIENYIEKHSILYFQYLLKDNASFYDSAINELRLKILPDILEASKSINTEQEKLLFNNFIQERFGIKNIC